MFLFGIENAFLCFLPKHWFKGKGLSTPPPPPPIYLCFQDAYFIWIKLLFLLLSPPAATAAAFCFCSHSETPARIISKYLQKNNFLGVFQFLQQNPRSPPKSYVAHYSLNRFIVCFMFGLRERPHPGRVLISFWCHSDNKNFDFFAIQNFLRIFQFCSFWLSSKFVHLAIHPCSDYF